MIANLFGLGNIKLVIVAILVGALCVVGYLYKNKLEENAYLEAQIASQVATIEALRDWNTRRDAISLERARELDALRKQKQKERVIVKRIHEKTPEWSNAPIPSGHVEFLRSKTTPDRDG